jgi:hydroxyacylglutathione hydrolase
MYRWAVLSRNPVILNALQSNKQFQATMIQIHSFVFGPFMENTFVLFDHTQSCVVIDPGCYETVEKQEIKDFIDSHGLKVEKLLNTHCHIDHVLGNAFIKNSYGVELYLHPHDEATLRAVETYAPVYGFPAYAPTLPDHFLEHGDVVTFGNSRLEVLFVPGHAPGHIAFYCPTQGFCIGGDVLFRNSIGRTDLPGGDYNTLIESIHREFFSLPDDTVVYCGHGPETTIGYEKRTNPFCAISS